MAEMKFFGPGGPARRAARRLLPRSVMESLRASTAGASSAAPAASVPDCGWPVEEENRRGKQVHGIGVRRFPFPYRCALAINNDTDGFRHAAFEALHAYVCGRGETAFGPGLGLEVADSFWVWAAGGELGLYHATPWAEAAEPSPEHERILELAKVGWLDTLHGFGAWNEPRSLDRDRIARALDYLDSRGVSLGVYVGHGGYNMTHNFGGPWGYYQNADNPDHESYCFDLLTNFGFRYHWTDVLYELDKFGDDLLFDDQQHLDREVRAHDFHRFFHTNDPDDYSRSREVFPGLDRAGLVGWRRRLFNHTIAPVTTRDGRLALVFKRFRGHDGPMAGNFIAQVNPRSLDELERRQGAAIVYQHFGVWRALFTGKRHESQRASVPETVLDEHNVWAFRILTERFRDGRVLVATTRRLLDFLRMRDHLDFRVEDRNGRTEIHLDGIDCPVEGRIAPETRLLHGLAFELPADRGTPVVIRGGTTLAMTTIPDPERPNRLIAYSPWQPLEFPD